MIHSWLLDYRTMIQPAASEAAAASATLLERLNEAMADVKGGPEWAVLSTCHRCEVYSHQVGADEVRRVLRAHFQPSAQEALAEVREECAARHLMRVAAGLDSMLLGETDVQRQVADALTRSTEQDSAGPVLNAVFGAAIHAGKRVRAETDIGRHSSSLASAAVDLVSARLGSVDRARAVVFGAGAMARRACERLDFMGIGSLTVINRTFERAERLAETHGGQPVLWDSATDALRDADIAIVATAAPEPFIEVSMLRGITKGRAARPLHLVDLAFPQNVQQGASSVANVRCYDFGGLEDATRASHAARAAEVPRAEKIIDQEMSRLVSWFREHEVAPSLRLLGELAAAARDDELARVWRRLPELTARQRRVVQTLAYNIARRLVRRPMLRLREAAGSDEADRYREALEYLFADLDDDTSRDAKEELVSRLARHVRCSDEHDHSDDMPDDIRGHR